MHVIILDNDFSCSCSNSSFFLYLMFIWLLLSCSFTFSSDFYGALFETARPNFLLGKKKWGGGVYVAQFSCILQFYNFCVQWHIIFLQERRLYLAIPIGDAIWDCRRSFFFLFFFFFFFLSATILSGPYLWNRYSLRLQIKCAAWSCGLIVHCCLPSNSLRYFYFFFFQDFVRAISLEPLLAETPN